MKALLSLLLVVVFLQSQAYAIHGGPGGFGEVSVVGTYSGVLIPNEEEDDEDNTALALFSLPIPDVGPGVGTLLVFANGRVFTGTITAIGDQGKGRIVGILQASFDFTISVVVETVLDPGPPAVIETEVEEIDISANAVGELTATPTLDTNPFALSTLGRLIGEANLDIDFGAVDPVTFEPITVTSLEFIVDGVKQSPTVVGASFGGGGGGGGGAL